jgi:hypothetical protein
MATGRFPLGLRLGILYLGLGLGILYFLIGERSEPGLGGMRAQRACLTSHYILSAGLFWVMLSIYIIDQKWKGLEYGRVMGGRKSDILMHFTRSRK